MCADRLLLRALRWRKATSHLIALVHVRAGAAEASVGIERILATLEELCHQSFRTPEALPSDPAAEWADMCRWCAHAQVRGLSEWARMDGRCGSVPRGWLVHGCGSDSLRNGQLASTECPARTALASLPRITRNRQRYVARPLAGAGGGQLCRSACGVFAQLSAACEAERRKARLAIRQITAEET